LLKTCFGLNWVDITKNGYKMSSTEDKKLPFLVAVSYLFSFLFIRIMVILAGSVNSPAAQAVKEGAGRSLFHIGRNVILFGYHIHHFYFGILFICVAGWLAIVKSGRLTHESLAIIFGVGLGLLMDEIGLLITWGNYYSSLSYLLGVLLLGIFLNIIFFPGFWKRIRGKVKNYVPPGNTVTGVIRQTVRVLDLVTDFILLARRYYIITAVFILLAISLLTVLFLGLA